MSIRDTFYGIKTVGLLAATMYLGGSAMQADQEYQALLKEKNPRRGEILAAKESRNIDFTGMIQSAVGIMISASRLRREED
jgi:hypothetical protein